MKKIREHSIYDDNISNYYYLFDAKSNAKKMFNDFEIVKQKLENETKRNRRQELLKKLLD
jgi:hypothetical protein